MVTVAVDGNGADLGPSEVAAGAVVAAQHGVRVLLFADGAKVGALGPEVELIDAPVSIAKARDPAYAVRSTPEASIVQAARAVAEGRAQALVSGGSTGSSLAAGLFHLKRDRGIYRPALALPIPRPGGAPVLVLDVGANVSCRAEQLVQFAHMGSAFAQAVMGVEEPRVALLSNGEEPAKGTPELREVHERLSGSEGAGLRFVGNIEGTQLLADVADVIVTDGFTGNVALKLIEGVSARTLRALRDAAMSSWRTRLGGLLLRPAVHTLREQADPEVTGGAYMLGLRQIGIVCHGRFTHRGFARAIEIAARAADEDVIGRTRAALERAGALRQAPHSSARARRENDAVEAGESAPAAQGASVQVAGASGSGRESSAVRAA